ncbi:MAG: hypothetical protein PUH24_03550 [Prevotellaceae bacterium]|nr:hypothetical protein [Prevotella sp.]MDD7257340.1 hypothetical protein [Prevotellaceae bacterium]MDY6131075.1 hypothetical protein [Prevotella sp.]
MIINNLSIHHRNFHFVTSRKTAQRMIPYPCSGSRKPVHSIEKQSPFCAARTLSGLSPVFPFIFSWSARDVQLSGKGWFLETRWMIRCRTSDDSFGCKECSNGSKPPF